jgi:hypothetical protein
LAIHSDILPSLLITSSRVDWQGSFAWDILIFNVPDFQSKYPRKQYLLVLPIEEGKKEVETKLRKGAKGG